MEQVKEAFADLLERLGTDYIDLGMIHYVDREDELDSIVNGPFYAYAKELKEKGIQIQGNSVKIHIGKKSAVAKGSLYLNEDIAKKADTEILEIERNKKDESFRTDD